MSPRRRAEAALTEEWAGLREPPPAAPPVPPLAPERAAELAAEQAQRAKVLADVSAERQQQNEKWGDRSLHLAVDLTFMLAVIGEEYGEVARNVVEWSRCTYLNDSNALLDMTREELIQLAAVCVASIQSIDALRPIGPRVIVKAET